MVHLTAIVNWKVSANFCFKFLLTLNVQFLIYINVLSVETAIRWNFVLLGLIQIMAASATRRDVVYFTFGDKVKLPFAGCVRPLHDWWEV